LEIEASESQEVGGNIDDSAMFIEPADNISGDNQDVLE